MHAASKVLKGSLIGLWVVAMGMPGGHALLQAEEWEPTWPMLADDATELQYQTARENRWPVRQQNSIDMTLMLIPAGEFEMGSSEEEIAWANENRPEWWKDETAQFHFAFEQPQHPVKITRPFLMGAHEVTIGQFQEFVAATGYETTAETDGRGGMYYNDGKKEGPEFNWQNPRADWMPDPTHPVTQVTYADAVAFCEWLTKKEGRHYRLPTEAEWEWAARAGSDAKWFFEYADEADRYVVMNAETPAPVGSLEANAFGLHDILGNVWEMTSDFADPDYYANSPVEDPQGPESGDARTRRGGAFSMSLGAELRTAYRKLNKEDYRGLHVGFRVVADLPERD